mmetsp:Transcript_11372/g.23026  ORF Transcript_11372/g.23026 Transcript_11372/m.23026 type:complete len:245 (-) Transcript_11372:3663-4397(-)
MNGLPGMIEVLGYLPAAQRLRHGRPDLDLDASQVDDHRSGLQSDVDQEAAPAVSAQLEQGKCSEKDNLFASGAATRHLHRQLAFELLQCCRGGKRDDAPETPLYLENEGKTTPSAALFIPANEILRNALHPPRLELSNLHSTACSLADKLNVLPRLILKENPAPHLVPAVESPHKNGPVVARHLLPRQISGLQGHLSPPNTNDCLSLRAGVAAEAPKPSYALSLDLGRVEAGFAPGFDRQTFPF